MSFTSMDYKILRAIINKDDRVKGMTRLNGTTIKEIIDKTSACDKKVRQTLKKFEEVGFVCKAIKQGKAVTYMITEEGLMELKSLKMNILGEVAK